MLSPPTRHSSRSRFTACSASPARASSTSSPSTSPAKGPAQDRRLKVPDKLNAARSSSAGSPSLAGRTGSQWASKRIVSSGAIGTPAVRYPPPAAGSSGPHFAARPPRNRSRNDWKICRAVDWLPSRHAWYHSMMRSDTDCRHSFRSSKHSRPASGSDSCSTTQHCHASANPWAAVWSISCFAPSQSQPSRAPSDPSMRPTPTARATTLFLACKPSMENPLVCAVAGRSAPVRRSHRRRTMRSTAETYRAPKGVLRFSTGFLVRGLDLSIALRCRRRAAGDSARGRTLPG